jgi:hypothetical protein
MCATVRRLDLRDSATRKPSEIVKGLEPRRNGLARDFFGSRRVGVYHNAFLPRFMHEMIKIVGGLPGEAMHATIVNTADDDAPPATVTRQPGEDLSAFEARVLSAVQDGLIAILGGLGLPPD